MQDLISRQQAIDALADMHCKNDEDGYVWIIRSDAWARIDALPSVTPKMPECEDAVSRKQVLGLAKDIIVPSKDGYAYRHRCIDPQEVKDLPSVTPTKIVAQINFDNDKLKEIVDEAVKRLKEELEPERKTGEWAYSEQGVFGNPYGSYVCSVCGERIAHKENFCPNCGADMRGEQDE